MEISVWHLIVTAITGPALILAIRETFDYFKKTRDQKFQLDKIFLKRKLDAAANATRIWQSQRGLLTAVAENFDTAANNSAYGGSKEFQQINNYYSNQLNEMGKQFSDVGNEVHLYFNLTEKALGYDPFKKFHEILSEMKTTANEANLLQDLMKKEPDLKENYGILFDEKVIQIKKQMKNLSSFLKDGEKQLAENIDQIKVEVNKLFYHH